MAKSISKFQTQCKFCNAFVELDLNEKIEGKYICPICNQTNSIDNSDVKVVSNEKYIVEKPEKNNQIIIEKKERGGCLTSWLFLIIICNIIGFIFFISVDEKNINASLFNLNTIEIDKIILLFKLSLFTCIINIISAILLLNWIRFGYWLSIITVVINVILNISLGFNAAFVILTAIIGLFILTLLVYKKWDLFETGNKIEEDNNKRNISNIYIKEGNQEENIESLSKNNIKNNTSITSDKEVKTHNIYLSIIVIIVTIIIVLSGIYFFISHFEKVAQENKQILGNNNNLSSNNIKIKDINELKGVYKGYAKNNDMYLVINNIKGNNFYGYTIIYWNIKNPVKAEFEGSYDNNLSKIIIMESENVKGAGKFYSAFYDGKKLEGDWYRYSDNGTYKWMLNKIDATENDIQKFNDNSE